MKYSFPFISDTVFSFLTHMKCGYERVQNIHQMQTSSCTLAAPKLAHFNRKTCSQTSSTGRFNFQGVEKYIYKHYNYAILRVYTAFSAAKWLKSIPLILLVACLHFTFCIFFVETFWHEIYLLNNFPDECHTLTHILVCTELTTRMYR